MAKEKNSRTCSETAAENEGKIKAIPTCATFGGFMGLGFFGPVGAAVGAGLGAFAGLAAGTILDSSLCMGKRSK